MASIRDGARLSRVLDLIFASIDASVKGAGTVGAAKEVIVVRKLLLAAILATSGLLSLAVTASAGVIPPCC